MDLQFDLSKYDVETGIVHPYFKGKKSNKTFNFYEGTLNGKNRFQYFEVPISSKAVALYRKYNTKYNIKFAKRYNHDEEVVKLMVAIEKAAVFKLEGPDAYLKYWTDCHSQEEKANTFFGSINHFEALKEHYEIKYQKFYSENKSKWLNEQVEAAAIRSWNSEFMKRIVEYLNNSSKTEVRKFSAITSYQAGELLKFCNWVNELYKPLRQTEINGLKIDQIALIYFYSGKQITRQNGNEIAKQYNRNSGEKLFQRFTFYSSSTNRKEKPTPCTPKKLKNKIELFESIVPFLTNGGLQRANDEIKILKTSFESEYQ